MKTIDIKGTIIPNDDKWYYDWFDMDSTSPNDVVLPDNGEPVRVVINSGGGDVYAGSEIYTRLRAYAGEVTVQIVGVAASAASVIAMAGNRVEISPTAQLMIHNVSAGLHGDHRDFAKMAETLSGFNQSIANSYTAKTGMSAEEVLALMAEETWLTADEAVEKGFADSVMFADEAPRLVASHSSVIPRNLIEHLRGVREDMHRLENEVLSLKQAQVDALKNKDIDLPEVAGQDDVAPKSLGFGAFVF